MRLKPIAALASERVEVSLAGDVMITDDHEYDDLLNIANFGKLNSAVAGSL